MSSPPPTDWSFEPTDMRDRNGRLVVVDWTPSNDAPIAVELGDMLAVGETLENVVCRLWLLKAYGETDHTDVTNETTLPGDPVVSGTIASQRVKSLVRGRTYRLYFGFGGSGNFRQKSVPIDVSDNA